MRFCLGFLTSIAFGMGVVFFLSIKKKYCICHLIMVNKEACPYLSISLIQQTFKLFVCSNFFTCSLEEQMSLNITVIVTTWRRKSLGQQVFVLESMKEHKIGSGGLISLQLWMQLMQNSEVASTGSMLPSFQQYIFLQNWWVFILINKWIFSCCLQFQQIPDRNCCSFRILSSWMFQVLQ